MEENYNNNQQTGMDGQSNYIMNQGEYQQSYTQSQYGQSQSQYGNPNPGYNQQYTQQNYGNSNYQTNFVPPQQDNGNLAPVMTVGDWIITSLLLAIPIANIVLLFVWAFDSGTNPNKKNFCRAALIFAAIGFGLVILFTLVIGSFIASMAGRF